MQNFAFKYHVTKKDGIGFPTKKSYNILPPCKISTLFLPCKSVQIEQKKERGRQFCSEKKRREKKKLVKGHGGKETVNFVDQ